MFKSIGRSGTGEYMSYESEMRREVQSQENECTRSKEHGDIYDKEDYEAFARRVYIPLVNTKKQCIAAVIVFICFLLVLFFILFGLFARG